jgi:outer membrane immunogenic protein
MNGGGVIMRIPLIGTILLAGVAPVFAADMPVKAPIAAQLAYSWSGFYAGVNGGGARVKADTDIFPGPSPAIFVNLLPQTLDPAPKGYFGGGQIGMNAQYGAAVLGFEGDVQSGIKNGTVIESPIIQNNGTPFPGALPGNNITISQQLNWWGTARIRLGVTVLNPRLMLFATAGVAFGQIQNTASTDFRPVGTELYAASLNEFRTGLVAGGGAEWAFTDNLSVKGEYLYMDFSTSSITANPAPPLPPFTVGYRFLTQVQVARAGLNFKFGGK